MTTEVMKVELEMDTCCICGGGGELLSPEEHDAGAPPMQVPLRTMLVHLNSSKVVPEGRLCSSCIRRTLESYEFSTALSSRGVPPLSEKIRALRRRLHELTQKIDVFIVVGGAGAGGAYSEEDIIMVERDTLAAAAAADDDDLERARNARGDSVYQCSVCPLSFQRVAEYRAHCATHAADALHSCWTCGAQFASRAALKEHLGAACGAALCCALCGRAHAAAAALRRHEAACPPRCPACGLLLADRAALAAHAAAQHGRTARAPHVCPQCFRTCDTPELLSAHLLRHRQAKQFVCGYDGCILRFGTRSNLMAHIRKCHTRDASPEPAAAAPPPPAANKCDDCGRTFGSAAALKRHARVHQVPRLPLQEEGNESQEGEDMEGEVEYLEVEELDDVQYRDHDDFEHKPDVDMH
ncbi:hypothetical protein PYW08_007935 [Mythimna loreyi]|uniref:Uncharacterized protein n=1 Tax=Mythimna loreyi TaxID=667449 RepID=A0ACC2QAJ3_9NEOP|nr:hypothetical protein PYW08_007935 [Mythimna loreyi]